MHAAAASLHVTRLALLCCLVACNGSKDDDGEIGGHCYPNATCNVGLSCSGGLCVVADAAVPDAAIDAHADAALDAFVCVADLYESNDSIANATPTPVDTTVLTKVYTANVCVGHDKDYYSLVISVANRNLELLVDHASGDTIVAASILNSGGVPIANAVSVLGMADRLRAYTPNLPTGTYYVEVFSNSPMDARHDYTMTLNVTGP